VEVTVKKLCKPAIVYIVHLHANVMQWSKKSAIAFAGICTVRLVVLSIWYC